MLTLEEEYIEEQAKIATSGAWIWLLTITTTTYSTPLRFTNNNADVTWPSSSVDKYLRAPITMEDTGASLDGKFPQWRLQIGELNVNGDLRTRIRATNGLVGSIIRLRVVHSDHYDLTTPAMDESAEILSCELDLNAVTFVLGVPSLSSKRFPRDRYVPGFCRHKFGGALCQYAVPEDEITSYNIKFINGVQTGDHPYNRIWVSEGNLIYDLFDKARPRGTVLAPVGASVYDATTYTLAKDIGFTISGSVYNDGFFLADSAFPVRTSYVFVVAETGGAKAFTVETVLTGVTISLGYNACDHTLNACKKRDNTQNYGGSPGITGGVYA